MGLSSSTISLSLISSLKALVLRLSHSSFLVFLLSSTFLSHFCSLLSHFLLVQCLLVLGPWLPSSWLTSLDIGVVLPPTVHRSLLVWCHLVDIVEVVDVVYVEVVDVVSVRTVTVTLSDSH